MRLFIAIEIAPEIREKITELISQMKPHLANAQWSRPEGLHITLKFLGNVPDELRKAIEDKLQKIETSSFSLTLKEIGIFPNPKSPRVLWTGIEAPPDLAQL